jgi:pimeloyl-ACP methyl ester carboxylesterase/DNA-binding CsgD family transcriptional regulator
LTPHVLRVLNMQHNQLDASVREDFFASFMEQQAVALALCDRQGAIRWMSRQLAETLERAPAQTVERIVRSAQERPSIHTVMTGEGPRRLVLVDVPALGPNFCALMLNTETPTALDASQLAQMYGLTPAEISIAEMLVQGISVEDIATAKDTAIATVRSQIKKTMAKLGVSRQAELVAMLNAHTAKVHFGTLAATGARAPVHSVLHYRGAQIAYNIMGPGNGIPVFFLHSWVGSRLQALRGSHLLFDYGIKLIAFDRMGMGASVADHLRLPRFSLLGYSLGALYAMQCATALEDRVRQLYLVCPVAPMRGLRDLKGLLPSGQLLMGLAMKAPVLAQALVRVWMAQMRRTPTLYLNSVMPHLPPSDAAAMQLPVIQEEYVNSFMEAIRQGDEGLLRELADMAQDWNHHRKVRQATLIWHGLQDSHVPYVYAERLATEMQSARLHGIPDAGHFLMFHHWDCVLAEIKAASSSEADKPLHPSVSPFNTQTKEKL